MKIIDSFRRDAFLALMLQCSVIPVISHASDITANGIRRVVGDETIGICFMTPKTVRITKSPLADKMNAKESLSVIATPIPSARMCSTLWRIFRIVKIEADAEPKEVMIQYDGSQTEVES